MRNRNHVIKCQPVKTQDLKGRNRPITAGSQVPKNNTDQWLCEIE